MCLRSVLTVAPRAGGHYSKRQAYMTKGEVKWFDATKGYGFIHSDDGGKDVFVQISAVERAGMQWLQ